MTDPVRRTRRRGFALMELLVGIALLALLATLLSGSLTFGRRVWERAETISDSGRRLAEIGFLRRSIAGAMAVTVKDQSGQLPQVPFSGQADRVSFAVFRTEEGTGLQRPYRLTFDLEKTSKSLVFAAEPLFTIPDTVAVGTPDERARPPSVLMRGVESLSLRYFGRLYDNDTRRWQERWDGQFWLPEIVEITLRFEADAGRPADPPHVMQIRPRQR